MIREIKWDQLTTKEELEIYKQILESAKQRGRGLDYIRPYEVYIRHLEKKLILNKK